MSCTIVLGANCHAGCPECGRRMAFFSGEKHLFMSEEKLFTADAVLKPECPVHGTFGVSAGEFRNELAA